VSSVRTFVGTIVLALTALGGVAADQSDVYGIKSAFVYNFIQFAVWPEDRLADGAPLSICVVADSPIVRELEKLADRVVQGHPLRVLKEIRLSELDSCHAVFLPAGQTRQLRDIVGGYPEAGLLLISEEQDAQSLDTAINMVIEEQRVRFDIDLAAAAAQRVQLSSKLVALARHVTGNGGQTPDDADPILATSTNKRRD
jgi:hypothetical protein